MTIFVHDIMVCSKKENEELGWMCKNRYLLWVLGRKPLFTCQDTLTECIKGGFGYNRMPSFYFFTPNRGNLKSDKKNLPPSNVIAHLHFLPNIELF